jgi:hypothetical protein
MRALWILVVICVIAPRIFSSELAVASSSRSLHSAQGSMLVLTTENGMGGICSILYVLSFPSASEPPTHYLFADAEEFDQFVGAITEIETPVVAEFQGFEISIALTASKSSQRLYGHVIGTGDKVIVLPASDRRK